MPQCHCDVFWSSRQASGSWPLKPERTSDLIDCHADIEPKQHMRTKIRTKAAPGTASTSDPSPSSLRTSVDVAVHTSSLVRPPSVDVHRAGYHVQWSHGSRESGDRRCRGQLGGDAVLQGQVACPLTAGLAKLRGATDFDICCAAAGFQGCLHDFASFLAKPT